MRPASVYLGGLPESIGRKELFSHLSIYGKINALNLQKGYAFVEFDSDTDAMDLIAIFADQPFMGHDVKVQLAKQPRRNSSASSNSSSSPESERSHPRLAPEHARIRYPVLVNNLNTHTCWQELKDFGRMAGGTVAFCDIDKTNRRRGFLEYFSQEDADRAVKELNGRELLGNVITMSGYGKKTLRPESHPRSRSRSPVAARHLSQRSRSRSPVARRYPQKDVHSSPEEPLTHIENPRRHVRFTQNERRTERSPLRNRRASQPVEIGYDYTDDFLYVSDERRSKMDQIAMGWMSLQSSYPPLRLS